VTKRKPEGQPKSKGGRPSKYDPAMCQRAIDMMAKGMSKEEVCYDPEEGLGIAWSTFQLWQEKHLEFSAAIREGERACCAWWQKTGRTAALGGIQNFNATAYVFNMKNRFGWADKAEVKTDHTSSDGSMSPTRIELVAPQHDNCKG